jgi:hypothetical protein
MQRKLKNQKIRYNCQNFCEKSPGSIAYVMKYPIINRGFSMNFCDEYYPKIKSIDWKFAVWLHELSHLCGTNDFAYTENGSIDKSYWHKSADTFNNWVLFGFCNPEKGECLPREEGDHKFKPLIFSDNYTSQLFISRSYQDILRKIPSRRKKSKYLRSLLKNGTITKGQYKFILGTI